MAYLDEGGLAALWGDVEKAVDESCAALDEFDFGFYKGAINSEGTASSGGNRAVCTTFPVRSGDVLSYDGDMEGLQASVWLYDDDGPRGRMTSAFIDLPITVPEFDGDVLYACPILSKNPAEAFTDEEIADLNEHFHVSGGHLALDAMRRVTSGPIVWGWKYFNANTGNNGTNAFMKSNTEHLYTPDTDVRLTATRGYWLSIIRVTFDEETGARVPSGASGWTSSYILEKGETYAINVCKGETWAAANRLTITPNMCQENVLFERIRATDGSPDSYAVGPDFVQRPVHTVAMGGKVKYIQSWCRYNGHYYSANQSGNFGVQDLEFNDVETVSLALGHANSLQLGHNGVAYASGWDDQKVYAVDLANRQIVQTYTLPTTGYTTVAVDDLNGMMYIFQRETRPNTIENYNFITYDYVKEEVVSTRKIRAFSAMQACDYYEGRIFVAYGGGSVTSPSGMFVCNTAGDVLAEYSLEAIKAREPEGVFFDRDTHEMLFSVVSGEVYRIEDGI